MLFTANQCLGPCPLFSWPSVSSLLLTQLTQRSSTAFFFWLPKLTCTWCSLDCEGLATGTTSQVHAVNCVWTVRERQEARKEGEKGNWRQGSFTLSLTLSSWRERAIKVRSEETVIRVVKLSYFWWLWEPPGTLLRKVSYIGFRKASELEWEWKSEK